MTFKKFAFVLFALAMSASASAQVTAKDFMGEMDFINARTGKAILNEIEFDGQGNAVIWTTSNKYIEATYSVTNIPQYDDTQELVISWNETDANGTVVHVRTHTQLSKVTPADLAQGVEVFVYFNTGFTVLTTLKLSK